MVPGLDWQAVMSSQIGTVWGFFLPTCTALLPFSRLSAVAGSASREREQIRFVPDLGGKASTPLTPSATLTPLPRTHAVPGPGE